LRDKQRREPGNSMIRRQDRRQASTLPFRPWVLRTNGHSSVVTCQIELAEKSALKPLPTALNRTLPAPDRTLPPDKRTHFPRTVRAENPGLYRRVRHLPAGLRVLLCGERSCIGQTAFADTRSAIGISCSGLRHMIRDQQSRLFGQAFKEAVLKRCACKNSDIATGTCSITGERPQRSTAIQADFLNQLQE
jgi:hypothetical protein